MATNTTDIMLDGDRQFEFSCMLQSGNTFIQLSQSSILYLEIKESIFNGFPEGFMVIDNMGGIIDSALVFSGDSIADLLIFYLKPKDPSMPDANYTIQEIFSIHKVEDIPTGEFPASAKRIHFRNIFANEMRNKKNTITIEDFFDEDISNFSDNERAVKTGDILKKLLGKDTAGGDVPRTADFPIDEENWDEGKYSIYPNWCPGTETLFDSVQKVYLKHISSEVPHDKCYIKYNRFDKKLALMSISKLLMQNIEDRENYFMENLVMGTLEGGSGETKKNAAGETDIPRPVVQDGDTLIDLSNIRSFKFNDLCGDILEKDIVVNIPTVIGFDNATRFDLGEQNIKKDLFDDFKKYYVTDPFDDKVDGGSALPSIIWINARKKITSQYNKVISTPYKSWDHAYDVEVRANILSALMFKGLTCTISLRGATHRTAGKFIDIEMKDEAASNRFAKIPGRWLVTECSHIIIRDKYWNSLNCAKTYRNF